MNIIHEDDRLFHKEGSGPYVRNVTNISGKTQYAKILVVSCCNSCDLCIGRKYNISNGCPICGNDLDSGISNYHHICGSCGSLTYSCGDGDVKMVGVTVNAVLGMRQDEDVI